MPTLNKIPVHCAHTRMARADKLKPHPRNPNQHSDQQIAVLAHIIEAVGWRNPIVVSKRSGYIIKGHARLAAANMIGALQVPVDEQEYTSEADEWQDLIADNRLSELAELDYAAVELMLNDDIVFKDFDLDLTGFDLFSRGDIKKKHEDEETTKSEGKKSEKETEQAAAAQDTKEAAVAQAGANNGESPAGVMTCPKCGFVIEGVATE